MSKVVLTDTSSGYRVSVINENFQEIQDELNDKVLYRDNPTGEPNQMESTLDMNSQRIINLPSPQSPNDAARLADIPFDPIPIGTTSALLTTFTPAGSVSAINVQAAIEEVASEAVLETDLASSASASMGAGMVGYSATTGYTAGTVGEKLNQFRSVKDNGATGNGVDDDTSEVSAVVAAAYAAGDWLFWPDGTYLTTASIANFHDVHHFGPGVVKRGSDLFYIEPTSAQTNTIYLATTGSDTNDGLSASQPMLTIQQGVDTLVAWGHALNVGTWGLTLAAGTYGGDARFPDYGLPSTNPLVIQGPSVGGHPNVPTVLIKDGATQSGVGILANFCKIYLKNLKFEDYNGSTSSSGFRGSVLYTDNVHATDCYYGLLVGGAGSILNVKGGIFDDCGYLNSTTISGVGGAGCYALFHAKLEVGTQNAGALTQGPIFTNNVNGFHCKEFCTGHLDWCTFEDNATGVNLWTSSRANVDGSSFKRNDKAIRVQTNSLCDPSSNTVFGTGVDANTVVVLSSINSNGLGEMALVEGNYTYGTTEYRIKTSYPDSVVTSTSSTNTVDSYTALAGVFNGPALTGAPSKMIRVVVKGVLAGTTGTYKRIALRLGASSVTFASFGSTLVGDFRKELQIDFHAAAVQTASSYGVCNGFPSVADTAEFTVDMSSNQTIALQAYVQNAADSITINSIEWFMSGV